MIDRRHFLRGSVLFAGGLMLGSTRVRAAQEPAPKPPDEKPEQKPEEEKPSEEKPSEDKPLVDADGREYRICPQCSAPMYRQGRTWTCDTCGYSYVE
jgi:hypothetical protein